MGPNRPQVAEEYEKRANKENKRTPTQRKCRIEVNAGKCNFPQKCR